MDLGISVPTHVPGFHMLMNLAVMLKLKIHV